MASLNKVLLIGNLTRDPELRYTSTGIAVADVNLAVSQKFVSKTGEKKEDVVFISVTVWGKQAEACGEYLYKGSSVFIEGRLQLDMWEGKAGEKRSRMRVVAQRVQFIGRPKGAKYGSSSDSTQENAGSEDQTIEENNSGADMSTDEEVPF